MHMAGAPPAELKKGLKQRHLTMIAMGGVIGAGLFVGSGVVIGSTGPGAFLSYAKLRQDSATPPGQLTIEAMTRV